MNLNKNKKFKFNPNAFVVSGASRSLLCDLERNAYSLVPNAMAKIILDEECETICSVVDKYCKSNSEEEIVAEYFASLIEKDLIFFTDNPQYYKKLSLEWDVPAEVTNAIIDLNNSNNYDYIQAIGQLPKLGCRNIQIRSYTSFLTQQVSDVLDSLNTSIVESVQFIIPYRDGVEVQKLIALIEKYPRIRFIQLYDAPFDSEIYSDNIGSVLMISMKGSLSSQLCCGVVSRHYFSIAIPTFTESQHHNTCLNRKISIDTHGNIKNCPSLPESYGNIRDTTLREALEKPGFKKYWNITKDQIEVCRDCEFRYICTDCRAYIEDPENIHSKPLKCGYNPYTCEWEEWSTNPLKQKAIEHYGMQELVKKETQKE